jgi:hypothetical protein
MKVAQGLVQWRPLVLAALDLTLEPPVGSSYNQKAVVSVYTRINITPLI